jgi:hypothetical protein
MEKDTSTISTIDIPSDESHDCYVLPNGIDCEKEATKFVIISNIGIPFCSDCLKLAPKTPELLFHWLNKNYNLAKNKSV